MSASHDLIIAIDRRLAQARDEIASLEAALTAFGRDAAATTATTAHASRTTRTKPKARPTGPAQVVPAGKLVALLGDSDGLSTGDLADRAGGDRRQVLTLLREMEAAGEVRREGVRRGTRWRAVSDEDRIAARVAELERQRRRA